jgi:molecular chaperone GrpE
VKKKEHETRAAADAAATGPDAPPAGAGSAPAKGTSAPASEGTSSPETDALQAGLERARGREEELLRALAELQNVQRRRRQEMEQALRFAHEPLVRELLPVLDDVERALTAMEGSQDDPLRAGVKLVLERLTAALERDGLEAVRPLDEPFDPELHDALAQRAAPGTAPHTVLEVVKSGYRYRGRVLRHAQVIVSADAAEEGEP